jgi:hypothetical protein
MFSDVIGSLSRSADENAYQQRSQDQKETTMIRHNMQKVSALSLVIDTNVNVREDYDVQSMTEEIKVAGRVLEPLHARFEDRVMLRGNRRLAAVQSMLRDATLPADLRAAISELDVFFYEGLTDKETTEMVVDHGSQKPLSRVEVVKTCWRLQKQMYSEREIITLMYQQLARYTGNTRKAYEAQQLPAGEAREKFLTTWLHGTVGNFILSAGQMGELMREQFILTERALDRNLSDSEKQGVKFETSRKRITELSAAKKKDKDSAAGWNPQTGGPEFNALVEKFIQEDKGPKPGRKEAFSAEQMKDVADSMQSPGMRAAFLKCAGALPEGERQKLDTLDTEYYRRDKVFATLTVNVDRIENPTFAAVIRAILTGTDGQVAEALSTLIVKAEPAVVVEATPEVVKTPEVVVEATPEVVAPAPEVVAEPTPDNGKAGKGRKGK